MLVLNLRLLCLAVLLYSHLLSCSLHYFTAYMTSRNTVEDKVNQFSPCVTCSVFTPSIHGPKPRQNPILSLAFILTMPSLRDATCVRQRQFGMVLCCVYCLFTVCVSHYRHHRDREPHSQDLSPPYKPVNSPITHVSSLRSANIKPHFGWQISLCMSVYVCVCMC